MLTLCAHCNELPAVPDWRVCGPCADKARHAAEAEARALTDAYETARERMLKIGCIDFIPQTLHERRLHKLARAKVLETMESMDKRR